VLTLAAAWFAYGLQRTDYVVFTVAITATIVFVLAVDHASEVLTAWHRQLATMLGGIQRPGGQATKDSSEPRLRGAQYRAALAPKIRKTRDQAKLSQQMG